MGLLAHHEFFRSKFLLEISVLYRYHKRIFPHFLVISQLSTYLCPPVLDRIKSTFKKGKTFGREIPILAAEAARNWEAPLRDGSTPRFHLKQILT